MDVVGGKDGDQQVSLELKSNLLSTNKNRVISFEMTKDSPIAWPHVSTNEKLEHAFPASRHVVLRCRIQDQEPLAEIPSSIFDQIYYPDLGHQVGAP